MAPFILLAIRDGPLCQLRVRESCLSNLWPAPPCLVQYVPERKLVGIQPRRWKESQWVFGCPKHVRNLRRL